MWGINKDVRMPMKPVVEKNEIKVPVTSGGSAPEKRNKGQSDENAAPDKKDKPTTSSEKSNNGKNNDRWLQKRCQTQNKKRKTQIYCRQREFKRHVGQKRAYKRTQHRQDKTEEQGKHTKEEEEQPQGHRTQNKEQQPQAEYRNQEHQHPHTLQQQWQNSFQHQPQHQNLNYHLSEINPVKLRSLNFVYFLATFELFPIPMPKQNAHFLSFPTQRQLKGMH